MPAENDFPVIFDELKNILKPYARSLTVKTDTQDTYYLDGPYSEKWKKELFFGSAQIKKNYVSFYLMPVYMYPELLNDISPELKKRMQGKSCFNFNGDGDCRQCGRLFDASGKGGSCDHRCG